MNDYENFPMTLYNVHTPELKIPQKATFSPHANNFLDINFQASHQNSSIYCVHVINEILKGFN